MLPEHPDDHSAWLRQHIAWLIQQGWWPARRRRGGLAARSRGTVAAGTVLALVFVTGLAMPRHYGVRVGPTPTAASSGFPDASNTGVPAGTSLTAYSGTCTITTAGTTIDSKTVDNCPSGLAVHAANVTISKSQVNTKITTDDGLAYSLSLTDSEVAAGTANAAAVGSTNLTVLRTEVTGGKYSVDCLTACSVQDSYLHAQARPTSTAGAGWQLAAVHSPGPPASTPLALSLTHNTLACDTVNTDAGGCKADVDVAGGDQLTLTGNQLAGGSHLIHCVKAGGGTQVAITGNTFVKGATSQCAGGGWATGYTAAGSGNSWSGNVFDDAAAVPVPPVNSYPDRWTVGAPGVEKPYTQTQTSLPVPTGYTVVNPINSSNEIDITCPGTGGTVTYDHRYFKGFLYLGTACYGTVNITNSIIAPPEGTNQRAILVNTDGANALDVNVSDTTIRPEPVALGHTNWALQDLAMDNPCPTPICHITITRVDAANTGGLCLCDLVTATSNWLHDTYVAHLATISDAHTGGIFPIGGQGPVVIQNNRLEPGVSAYTNTETPNAWQAITTPVFTQSAGGSNTLQNGYLLEGNCVSMGGNSIAWEMGSQQRARNNVIGPGHFGRLSIGSAVTIAEWTGNVEGDVACNSTGVTVPNPKP